MKGLFLTAALGAVCVSAFAQGTLYFGNNWAPGAAAQVFNVDGVTPLSGSAWSADLYWASGTVTDSTLLTALNQPATFATGPLAGYFFGGTETIPGAPGGSLITAQVRVWDTASGNSWAQAAATPLARVGESILFQVQLTDPGVGNPAFLSGLSGHPWSVSVVGVPEPSTIAFAGLGLAGILVRRSRRQKRIGLNEARQPAPDEAGSSCSESAARRGCAGRWAAHA